MIEAVGVGKAFGGIEALRDVDLTVPAGSVLCLLKTTLVNILSTVFPPCCRRAGSSPPAPPRN